MRRIAMSETDPAASSESGSDLLAELARHKERIARLEALLAETRHRADLPETDPGEVALAKISPNSGQTPVRLRELGPQLAGFAEAFMAYTAPKRTPPGPRQATEPTMRLTHLPRRTDPISRPKSPQGMRRSGLLALLVGAGLLAVVFAGA